MRSILKSYRATLCRHAPVTVLNLLGLAAAFVAFMLIFMQVSFELGYDKFRKTSDRLYRFEMQTSFWGAGYGASVSRFHGEQVMKLSAAIDEAGMAYGPRSRPKFQLPAHPEQGTFNHTLTYCTTRLPATLELEAVEGSLELNERSQILIPQSVARKMFGRSGALGAHLRIEGEFLNLTDNRDFYVSGVYRDIPKNSVIPNAFFVSEQDHLQGPHAKGQIDQVLYVRLHSPQQKEAFEALLNDKDVFHIDGCQDIRLQLLADAYFARNGGSRGAVNGSFQMTLIFISIAVLILIVALINYFNFSVSLIPLRARSMATQKILGSTAGMLRRGMILESVLFCLAAYALALFGLYAVESASLMSYLQADMTLSGNVSVLLLSAGIAVAMGLTVGVYPALYAASIPPMLSIQGSFGHSGRGKRLRIALIGFQYVIAIGLILSAVFMNLQYRLIRNQDMGFDTHQIMTLPLTQDLARQYRTFHAMMAAHPTVSDVAYSDIDIVGEGTSIMDFRHGEQASFRIHSRRVSANFIPMMGFQLSEGRGFRENDEQAKVIPVILNRRAQREMELKIGDRFDRDRYEVVGVVEDFHFRSLHSEVEPFMFTPSMPLVGRNAVAYLNVKTSDYAQLMAEVSHAARVLDPNCEAEPAFLDSRIESLYRTDSQNIALVSFFSLLAIVISLSGVFSLVFFEIRHKRHEIGVRRVFAATIVQILGLLNKNYLRMVIVSFALGAPLAWYAVRHWLQAYTIQVPMYGWVFALVLLVVGALTVLTVVWLSYRVASENPVKALRSE